MKKMILATLAYAIVTMLIAAPWHFILFKDLYHSFGIYNRVPHHSSWLSLYDHSRRCDGLHLSEILQRLISLQRSHAVFFIDGSFSL